jgi:hypothetical protein
MSRPEDQPRISIQHSNLYRLFADASVPTSDDDDVTCEIGDVVNTECRLGRESVPNSRQKGTHGDSGDSVLQ